MAAEQSPAQEVLCLDLFQALAFIPARSPLNSCCCYTFWVGKVQENWRPQGRGEAQTLQHKEPFKIPRVMTRPFRSALCLSSSFEECHLKIHVQFKLSGIRIIAREENKRISISQFCCLKRSILALQAGCQQPALRFGPEQG